MKIINFADQKPTLDATIATPDIPIGQVFRGTIHASNRLHCTISGTFYKASGPVKLGGPKVDARGQVDHVIVSLGDDTTLSSGVVDFVNLMPYATKVTAYEPLAARLIVTRP